MVPNYNPYFMQNQNVQYGQNMPTQQSPFISVRNEMEARNYPVAYGNSVTFKDENAPFVYSKTMGFSQLDEPVFEKYRLIKEDATIEIEEIDVTSNDEATARITVRDFLRMDTIGTEGHLVKKASYILHLEEATEDKVRWKVRMEGLPQSERRNRD